MEKDAKEKLIEAGEELFAKKGLAGVSIRELAKAAGANSALISYHFGGKEGLYEAVLEKQFSPIGLLLDTVVKANAEPKEKIMIYARSVAAVHNDMPLLTKYLMGEMINPSKFFEPVVRKYIERIYRFMAESLQKGIDIGQFRNDLDVAAATLALAGMMNFYFISRPLTRYFTPDGAAQNERYAIQAVEIFLNGVSNHEDK